MKHSKLLDRLQNLIGFEPKPSQIAKILDCAYSTIGNRAQRDSEYNDEEIEKIESFYGIVGQIMGGDVNCVELDYIHINPSCGHGTVVLDDAEVTPIRLGKELIKSVLKTDPENLKLFKASGDSMEHVITDNDLLLVDVSRTDFNNGGIFVLTINNDWFVKRLRLRVTGELDIISDNDKYPMETLQPDSNVEICVKGRVIKNLSKGL